MLPAAPPASPVRSSGNSFGLVLVSLIFGTGATSVVLGNAANAVVQGLLVALVWTAITVINVAYARRR